MKGGRMSQNHQSVLPPDLLSKLKDAEAYIHAGQLQRAAFIYEQTLYMVPAAPDLHHTLGLVYLEQSRTDPALFHIGRSIELDPHNSRYYRSMGDALSASGQLPLSILAYRKACAIDPGNTDARLNLGTVYHKLDAYDQARSTFQKILDQAPDHLRALNNLGKVYHDMGRLRRSLACYNRCITLQPHYAEARFNRAALLLAMGDYEHGWQEYEWRFKRSGAGNVYPHRLRSPRWQGDDYHGRRLLVHCEQGMGDTLQFIRYIPLAKERGGTLMLEAHPPLVPQLRSLSHVDETVIFNPERPPVIHHDLHIPLLSLPALFDTGADTIPATIPYIRIDPSEATPWLTYFKKDHVNIGLVWASSDLNPKRNLPVDRCGSWFQHPDLHFISLQKGGALGQLMNLESTASPSTELGSRLKNFHDTAAVMSHLDLMISVDTAAAHLAGAMGIPLWVLLPFNADWRWPPFSRSSPWYPSARLFRQTCCGDWKNVIDNVAVALADVEFGSKKPIKF
jgi:tetratricopeptide (TPR) repeat protein